MTKSDPRVTKSDQEWSGMEAEPKLRKKLKIQKSDDMNRKSEDMIRKSEDMIWKSEAMIWKSGEFDLRKFLIFRSHSFGFQILK